MREMDQEANASSTERSMVTQKGIWGQVSSYLRSEPLVGEETRLAGRWKR